MMLFLPLFYAARKKGTMRCFKIQALLYFVHHHMIHTYGLLFDDSEWLLM